VPGHEPLDLINHEAEKAKFGRIGMLG